MKTRYCYLGDSTIEVVVDGDEVQVNILPTQSPPPEERLAVAPPEPLGEAQPTEVPYTKKKRTLMGAIRAGWFVAFTGMGGMVDYALQNLTSLPIPPGTATAVGAALYGAKRALWPDSTI